MDVFEPTPDSMISNVRHEELFLDTSFHRVYPTLRADELRNPIWMAEESLLEPGPAWQSEDSEKLSSFFVIDLSTSDLTDVHRLLHICLLYTSPRPTRPY